tara:strand:- start:217 stop:801 length:585 start_codon:yes stop_codon:yes gene_type:complete
MNTKETLNKVRTLLGIEVKLEQMKLDNGAILEAEVFEVGAEVFVVADTELVALPIGEYISEDGSTIVVLEEGVIGEIKEAGAEEEAPAAEEAPVEEEVVEEDLSETATPKKVVESISKETFFSEIEKLRNEINELKLSKEVEVELSTEKVELSVDEVEGISHNPENETSKKELNLYSQKGKNNTINRIFNKLNN